MGRIFQPTIFLLALITINNASNPKDVPKPRHLDGFYNWIEQTFEAFPTWVQDRGLDPTPITPGPADIRVNKKFLQLDCQIWDYYASGFVTADENYWYSDYADLLDARMQLRIAFYNNVTLAGNYKANGTVLGIPLQGEGSWRVVTRLLSQSFFLSNFDISSQGSINASSSSSLQESTLDFGGSYILDVEFEGLFDGGVAAGLEDAVKISLAEGLNNFISAYGGDVYSYPFPIEGLVHDFYVEALENTPVSDIIGMLPPSRKSKLDM